nr:MAG TPA: hypothetical protein [Caudoviricetes sp.]
MYLQRLQVFVPAQKEESNGGHRKSNMVPE